MINNIFHDVLLSEFRNKNILVRTKMFKYAKKSEIRYYNEAEFF